MSHEGEQVEVVGRDDAVTGWRVWRLRKRIIERDPQHFSHAVTYWLQALQREHAENDEWVPGRTTHAKCRGSLRRFTPHRQPEVPHPSCSCGYSAYRTFEELLCAISGRHLPHIVIGQVAMWGRVVRSASVLRSAFAIPTSLYIPSTSGLGVYEAELVAEALGVYGVSVEVASFRTVWRRLRT